MSGRRFYSGRRKARGGGVVVVGMVVHYVYVTTDIINHVWLEYNELNATACIKKSVKLDQLLAHRL